MADKAPPRFAPRTSAERTPSRPWSRQYMRYALLGIALLMSAGIITPLMQRPELNNLRTAPQSPADTNSPLPHINIKGVIYKGQTDDGGDFALEANAVTQSSESSHIITLTAPRTKIDHPNRQSLIIHSNKGLYNQTAKQVDLAGRVVITQPAIGHFLYTESATALLEEGTIESTSHVRAEAPDTIITAGGMRILNQGQHVIFTGKSRIVFDDGAQ